jgi:hypothetical protein
MNNNMTTFLTHYLQNKDKLWDYYELCGNPQVNVDIIKALTVE